MRYLIALGLLAGTLCSAPAHAAEQSYPVRPIRVVVPVPAGSGSDFFARTIGAGLAELYKQQVVVDNRPGAGGLIGGTLVANASADGYTLGLASTSHNVSPLLQKQPPYRPLEDFTPVAQLAAIPNVLVVAPAVPAKTVQEFVTYLKSRPGQLNYASLGPGTAAHLAVELFNRAAGVQVEHVPFKNVGDLLAEMLSGRVQYLMFVTPSALPLLKDGRLRPLAVSGNKRNIALPNTPTVHEAGLPEAHSDVMFGVVAPAGLPRPVLTRLHADLVQVMRTPETRKRFELQGAEPEVETTPAQYASRLKAEYEQYRKLLPVIGLQPQ